MYLLYVRSYAIKQNGKPSTATQCDKPLNRDMLIMLPEYEGRSRQLLHDDKSRSIVVAMFISGRQRVCLVLWQSSYYILGTFQDFSFDAHKPRK